MFTDFNKIYSMEIDLKSLEVVHNSKALYSNVDLNTSTMMVKLSMDQKSLNLTDTTITAYIKAGKNNNVTMQRCEILEPVEGIVGLDFKSSALQAGTNTFFLEIKSKNGEIINSPLITYKVVELFDVSEGTDGDNNTSILVQLISEVDVIKESVETLRDEITAAEEIRKSNESTRVESENQRVTSETSRETAETSRTQSESVRVENEKSRIAAESNRVENEKSRVSAESGRVSSESERVLAETKRAEDFENMKNEIKNHISNHPDTVTIDDEIISKEKTWSSSKIEDFIHTNDDVVWGTVQGENLSVDYTKEGYLREIEVFGNTWQDDTDSKNLFDINSYNNPNDGYTNEAYRQKALKLKPNTTYTMSMKRVKTTAPSAYIIFQIRGYASGKGASCQIKEDLSVNAFVNKGTFTTDDTGIIYITCYSYPIGPQWFSEICGDIQIEEGEVATDYVPYHKADLSNIKHLGELYVDEEGQPILDSEGREQYKIEVESYSDNFYDEEYTKLQAPNLKYIDGGFEAQTKDTSIIANLSDTSIFNPNIQYTLKFNYKTENNTMALKVGFKYADGSTTISTLPQNGESVLTVKSVMGKKITKIGIITIGVGNGNGYTKLSNIQISVDSAYIKPKSHKTTLLLPCQLSKVGDVADRLYWDNEKKKYVVEKNVYNTTEDDIKNITTAVIGNNGDFDLFAIKNFASFCFKGKDFIANDINLLNDKSYLHGNGNVEYCLPKGLVELNIISFRNYLTTNNIKMYIPLIPTATPQLIETNITEKILLQCYKDKTHLFVTGGIDGGIKAKVPLDGGQAIQSLSAENNVLKTSNIELKQTNEIQDVLIDTTMMATDEMFTMFEPLLSQVSETLQLTKEVSKLVDMYVAMVMRGLKKENEVPERYREQVKEILAQLEK